MQKSFLFCVLLLVLLLCLTGCRSTQARLGSYVYVSQGANRATTYTVELKPEGECIVSEQDSSGLNTLGGKYTLDGDKLSLSLLVWGTNRAFHGHFAESTLVLEDGPYDEHDMHLTKQP